jgi:glycosyltransferase involved in cell wall biosynthesis
MNLLVVSHPCVTPVNQAFYAGVERQTGWDLTLVGPASWEGEYGTRTLERWPAFEGDLRPIPVWFSGNVPLHVYRSWFIPLLREVAPDAIFLHHEPYAAATAQVFLANRLSVQCPIGFFTWQNIEKTYPPPFRQLERMVYRQADYAVSGSESARAVLRRKGYAGPASLIPAGINPERYSQTEPMPDAAPLDAPEDSVLIGFVGRIVKEKGLGTFLDALAQIRPLPWHFVLIGEGDFTDVLQQRAERLGLRDRLTVLGYVDHAEIPRYLAVLDLVVLPSETQSNWKEQFGRILIESMAAGTPVLGSDSGEIPHLIERTGGGRSFDEGDPDACAAVLAELIRDERLRDRLGLQGRNAVLDHYTHETLARSFIETIEDAR